jgi:2-oxoglutarate dehydrogenase E2 component (dihydrolipoamide succinyltransferase)
MKKQIPVVMPQMGQSVAEGTITRWLKKVGDSVQEDEPLLEVETDKTTVEVESPAAGELISRLKAEGERAAAGETVGVLAVETAVEDPKPAAKPAEAQWVYSAAAASSNGGVSLPEIDSDRYSPYVIRMALFNGISLVELQSIKGTGRHGRVTKGDLLAYLARRPIPAAHPAAVVSPEPEEVPAKLQALGEVVPMSSLRRTIADHMVQSIHTSAHVTMIHAVDVTHVVQLRERLKMDFERRFGAKMTYTGVLMFVTSRVLRDFPKINASIVGTNIVLRKEINIGCAVARADETLVVPVLKEADRKSFPQIARDLAQLITRARQRELKREDVEGGTFTISNFGSFGSLFGTPIINQPQVAILGMGAVHKEPVVRDGQVVIRDILYLSFSFDHRIIDGDLGGRFLHAIDKATAALTESDLTEGSL